MEHRLESSLQHPLGLIDETGKRYGRLVVVRYVGTGGMWLCRCDCGREGLAEGRGLRAGERVSCGCHVLRDETGKHYGRLKVIRKTVRKSAHGSYWECRCECGSISIIRGDKLRDGTTRSCGCLARQLAGMRTTKLIPAGQRFGRLTVLSQNMRVGYWLCLCDCKEQVVVCGTDLRNGTRTMCCSCARREGSRKGGVTRATHGHTRGYQRSLTYSSWRAMKARVLRTDHKSYPRYGGRGITICQRWMNFKNFLADMGTRPRGTTLDRTDGDGNYEPGNCRWATAQVQGQNARTVKLSVEKVREIRRLAKTGVSRAELADQFGVTPEHVYSVVCRKRFWKNAEPERLPIAA